MCGTVSLAQRAVRYIPGNRISYMYRNELTGIFSDRYPVHEQSGTDGNLFLNGRVVWDEGSSKELRTIIRNKKDAVLRRGTDWIAVYRTADDALPEGFFDSLKDTTPDGYAETEMVVRVISYPWDLIDFNAACITSDFMHRTNRGKNKIQGRVHPRAVITPKKNVMVGRKTVIGPYVAIDASKGPVIIGESVTIEPHVFIQGPVWIGAETKVKSGARIYGGTSIGYNCRAAGEINSSIIHSYSNKAHEGFLGHSYLGQWINIGADTNNSNLKNDYGDIRVMLNGKPVETGKQFFGMVMGDHGRTGINTMINTGTIVGVGCNIFGANFPPKYIPDFSWGGADFLRVYQFEKFLQNAHAMTGRRRVTLTNAEIQLLRKLYDSRESK